MLIDLNKEKEKNFHDKFDVLIVGTGAAGITIATKLEKKNKKIALIEGGGIEFSEISQTIYKGKVNGDPYFELDAARLRYFGGSTNHWTGMCRSFDDIDFNRGYIGEEYIWPIELSDIEKYHHEACSILEISDSFLNKNIISSNIKQISFNYSSVRFKEKFLNQIVKSKSISLFLNANLTGLSGKDRIITNVSFKNYYKKEFNISANKIILALGGIENSRFLLFFNKIYKDMFFDSNLPFGKYFMEHPHFNLGDAIINRNIVKGNFYSLSSNFQIKKKIFNCGLRIMTSNDQHLKKLVKDILCIAPKIGKKFANLMHKKLVCSIRLDAAWEQAPNIQNAVTLDESSADKFNIPRVALNLKKMLIDKQTILESVLEFNKWLIKIEGGRIRLDDWVLEKGINYTGLLNFPKNDEIAGYHHMGGTRMHYKKEFGVVDSNCKVFGSKNLYIAGSSIFTTGGHNNPTLPIVQFSLRLADHLIK